MRIRVVKEGPDGNPVLLSNKNIRKKDAKEFFRRQNGILSDILECNVDSHIHRLIGVDNVQTSYCDRADHSGFKAYTGGKAEFSTETDSPVVYAWDNPVDLPGGEVNLGVDIYEHGYVLSTGKQSSNILGGRFDSYVYSLRHTRSGTTIRSSSKSCAKVFSTMQSLVKWLEKNQRSLQYFAGEYGYQFGIDHTCQMSEEDFLEEAQGYSLNREEKEETLRIRAMELLSKINAEEAEFHVPVFAETNEAEAVRRLEEIGCMDEVITNFQDGHLFQSEVAGILYDLDPEAEKAVEDTKQYGLPYHVIKNGEMYAVLYVSNYRDEWETEVYDRRNDIIHANVWNSGFQMAEMGSIRIRPANGGVERYA